MKNLHLTSPLAIKQAYFEKLKTFCLTASEKDLMLFFEHCHLDKHHIEHHFSPEKYHQTLTCGQSTETSNELTSCHLCRTFMRSVTEVMPERPELKQFFKRTPSTCPICAEQKRNSASLVYHFVENIRSVHDSKTIEHDIRNNVQSALQTHSSLYHELIQFMTLRSRTFEHILVRIMVLEQRTTLHDYYVEWIEEQSLPNGQSKDESFSATLKTSPGNLSRETHNTNPLGFFIDTFDVVQTSTNHSSHLNEHH